MSLSKSKYTRGIQCLKSLWLYQHKPELCKIPDAMAQARMDTGTKVGEIAQLLFPNGKEIVFNPGNFQKMLGLTKTYMEEGIDTIYEASFSRDGVFVACDILHHSKGGWELYEVKSSTSVKDYHRHDVAIQWYVLEKAGLRLSKSAVVHINSDYIRQGDLEIDNLFTIEDITDETIARQEEVTTNVKMMKEMLSEDEPNIPIGPQCNKPFECDYKDYCWKDVPELSVFNLYNLREKEKFNLYHSGIHKLGQIPPEYPLSHIQQLQLSSLNKDEPILDKAVIREFLNRLCAPLYYLDFETFQDAIPRYNEQRPYEQVPFQFSLHIDESGVGLDLEHKEYLANHLFDPRREFAEKLIHGLNEKGSIIVFNMSFEKRIITSLANLYPDLSNQLLLLNNRIVDLLEPFKKGGYYNKDMKGSFSIKSVLPALFPDSPELRYDQLDIQNGAVASNVFSTLEQLDKSEEIDTIRKDLLEYCELDTLAMVRIVELLKHSCSSFRQV